MSSSSSANGIGLLPLTIGAWTVWQTVSTGNPLSGGVGIETLAGFLGGFAAVAVGTGVLLGIGEFEVTGDRDSGAVLAFGSLAVVAFGVGIAVELL